LRAKAKLGSIQKIEFRFHLTHHEIHLIICFLIRYEIPYLLRENKEQYEIALRIYRERANESELEFEWEREKC
jgi:hypothetical protein